MKTKEASIETLQEDCDVLSKGNEASIQKYEKLLIDKNASIKSLQKECNELSKGNEALISDNEALIESANEKLGKKDADLEGSYSLIEVLQSTLLDPSLDVPVATLKKVAVSYKELLDSKKAQHGLNEKPSLVDLMFKSFLKD